MEVDRKRSSTDGWGFISRGVSAAEESRSGRKGDRDEMKECLINMGGGCDERGQVVSSEIGKVDFLVL